MAVIAPTFVGEYRQGSEARMEGTWPVIIARSVREACDHAEGKGMIVEIPTALASSQSPTCSKILPIISNGRSGRRPNWCGFVEVELRDGWCCTVGMVGKWYLRRS